MYYIVPFINFNIIIYKSIWIIQVCKFYYFIYDFPIFFFIAFFNLLLSHGKTFIFNLIIFLTKGQCLLSLLVNISINVLYSLQQF